MVIAAMKLKDAYSLEGKLWPIDSIFKSRDITLSTKVHVVKAKVFPVVMYGCESWTIKTAECRRIDAFELWCWRRLLRVPWIARRSNQSILKEISSGCSLEGLMLKLKLQYFGHLMQRADSFEKTLMLERLRAGGEGDDRGWDGWMASLTQWTWVWVNSESWWWTGRPGMLQFMGSQRVGHDWVTELSKEISYKMICENGKISWSWVTEIAEVWKTVMNFVSFHQHVQNHHHYYFLQSSENLSLIVWDMCLHSEVLGFVMLTLWSPFPVHEPMPSVLVEGPFSSV